MTTLLREQIACLLTTQARQWLARLDKRSTLYQQLQRQDVDALLQDNVRKICVEMTFAEMCKAIGLAAKFAAAGNDKGQVEKQIKEIARGIVARIEAKHGGFSGPASCRNVLSTYLSDEERQI